MIVLRGEATLIHGGKLDSTRLEMFTSTMCFPILFFNFNIRSPEFCKPKMFMTLPCLVIGFLPD